MYFGGAASAMLVCQAGSVLCGGAARDPDLPTKRRSEYELGFGARERGFNARLGVAFWLFSKSRVMESSYLA